MSHHTITASELERAKRAAETVLQNAISIIDELYEEGYALKNPQLVMSIVKTQENILLNPNK